MDLGSAFLLLALVILVGLFITKPFLQVNPPADRQYPRPDLLAEREKVLTTLQELDFDAELGKVPPDEYAVQRAELLQKGASILRELEEVSASPDIKKSIEPASVQVDEVEELIATRRREIAARRRSGFCPKCGGPVYQNDTFCSRCGEKLEPTESK